MRLTSSPRCSIPSPRRSMLGPRSGLRRFGRRSASCRSDCSRLSSARRRDSPRVVAIHGVMQLPLLGGEGPGAPVRGGADLPGIRVGTCGFSYRDWVGVLYPVGTKAKEMLELYARSFSAVEIDSTYYRVPAPATFASMAERTPPGFRFSVKLPGAATHLPADVTALPPEIKDFRAALKPLVASGKFLCGLAQFPNSFKPSAEAERRLRALRKALPEMPLVAEFRHRDWQAHATLELLAELGIGWCNVDMTQFSKMLRVSA